MKAAWRTGVGPAPEDAAPAASGCIGPSRLAGAALVALAIGLAACGGPGARVTPAAPPEIRSLTATPSTVDPGGSATLEWAVSGATSLSIDHGVGAVTGASVTVAPAETTTFTLTAVNGAGAVTAQASVTVRPAPKPQITGFSASPAVITAGGSATLEWAVSGATSLSIDQGVGAVTGTSVTVAPTVTTVYTLTATNAAGAVTGQVAVTVTPAPKPQIATFSASPGAITAGGSTTLAWSVSGATSIAIDQGIGVVSGTSRSVAPVVTTTYTLTATNGAGSVTAQVQVTVTQPPAPQIASFTAAPTSIAAGGTTVLAWSVTGATTLTINQGVGTVTGTSVTVAPAVTTTYTLTAASAQGTATAQVAVTVTPRPVIAAFSASPTSITAGGSAVLSWSVAGATSLSISGIGTVTGTSATVSPTATTTYTLTATNAAGPATAQATVTVTAAPAPQIASFTASPTAIASGGSSTLAWSVTGATALSISGGVGTVTGSSVTVAPTATTTYTLTATNAAGPATAQVTVTVTPPPPPQITSFTASPASIPLGGSTTLAWSATGATTLSISGIGTVTGTSAMVSPTVTTTYTLTATNAQGVATAQVAVTVVPRPVISGFAASPSVITAGASTVLSWSVAGATSLAIDQGVGTVTGASITVSPSVTTAYTLTATNASGPVTAQATVTVVVPLPAITSFTASPSSIFQGGSATLAWSVTGATSLSISGVGTVTGTSVVVSPTVTTTYTLTATNAAGPVTAQATVTVVVPLPAITSFTASPASIYQGGSATLAWSVTGATSLSISGVGTVTGTSVVVSPTVTTTYTLTATNAAGLVTAQAAVTVVPPPAITSFTASPTSIYQGGSATLAWSVTGATSLSISGIGTVTGTSVVVSPTVTTTYTLTATNAAGPVTAQAIVTVVPPPIIASFTASPTSIVQGGSATLAWSVTGATSLSISGGVGTVTGTSVVVSPTVTTTYTLTATNAAGPVTAQAIVTVVPPPTITSFTASPTSIYQGGSATLAWSVTGATSLSISGGVGTVTGTSVVVSPTVTTTYTLTATNAAGPVTAQAIVTVVPPPTIASFTASPASIVQGGSATLAWSVTGATSLSISGVGTVTGTSVVVSPTVTTTYTLTATNASGPVTAQAIVTVVPPPTIASFTASPTSIVQGGSATLAWSVTGATSLSISGVGTVTGTSVVVSPTVTTTYTLTATNAAGPVTAQAAVTVTGGGCGDTTADPANCGACGHVCVSGVCAASVCQLVLKAVDPLAQPPNGGNIAGIDRAASEQILQDRTGAGDLVGLFYADTASSGVWYLLVSADGGATWSYLPASSGTAPATRGAWVRDQAIAQDTVGYELHHLTWLSDADAAVYDRVALARDLGGHVSGWSWEASDIAGPSSSLAGWPLGGWHYAKMTLREVVDGNGTHELMLTLQDRPSATRVNRVLATRTTGLAPTGAASWFKITASTTVGADVLVAENTDAGVDPDAFLNLTGRAPLATEHEKDHTFAQLPADRSIHVFSGHWFFNDTTQGLDDIRRWRFTSSGANWVRDSGANGVLVTNDNVGDTPDVGNAVATDHWVWFTFSDAAGLHVGRIGTEGTWTSDAVPQPDGTNTRWWYSAISPGADEATAWIQYERNSGAGSGFAEFHGFYDGTSWRIQDDTSTWLTAGWNQADAWLPIVLRDGGVGVMAYAYAEWLGATQHHHIHVLR